MSTPPRTPESPAAAAPTAPRLTVPGVLAEIADELFSLDRGLPHTVLSLARSPGATAWRYIHLRDPRLTRPFRLALVVLAAAALLLHFSGAGAEFQAGVQDGARGESRGEDALARVLGLLFARFDVALVLCWVPAVAYGFQAAFAGLRPNFAEAVAFSLYALAGLVPVQLALLLGLPMLGVQPLWSMLAVPLLWLGWAGYGYACAAGERRWSALGLPLLGPALMLVLFLAFVTLGVLLVGLVDWLS